MNTTTRIPFNLARALAGAGVVTRDGREVADLKMRKGTGRVYALSGKVKTRRETWTRDGRAISTHRDTALDLFMAEEK